jgi:hypothetical protein
MMISFLPGGVLFHLVSCQIITSTLLDGRFTCPGREVVITCATNASLVVAWSSDEYIGRGGLQLEFTSGDNVGRRLTSTTNPNTFAELTMKSGELVTESQLHIIVSMNIPTVTVTCSDVNGGSTSSLPFQLLRKYIILIPYSGKFSWGPIVAEGQSLKFLWFNFHGRVCSCPLYTI